ncbi:MAG: hypothetical protein KDB05_28755, partial [Planctomycetales bacterium]|nr:hypothetical protein [Planctomycetales bacterium]
MATARITLVASLCLIAGCQTIGRKSPDVESQELADPGLSSQTPHDRPFEYLPTTTGTPSTYVQPVSHIQPAQPVVVPEPLDAVGPDSPAALTLQQLEEMAITANPVLAKAQAFVDAARGKWVQVGLPPNTALGYSGQQIGSHGQAEQNGVYLQQEFVRGGKLRLNRAIVDQKIAQAEQILATQQQRVLTDVRLGFYDVLIAQRRTE